MGEAWWSHVQMGWSLCLAALSSEAAADEMTAESSWWRMQTYSRQRTLALESGIHEAYILLKHVAILIEFGIRL